MKMDAGDAAAGGQRGASDGGQLKRLALFRVKVKDVFRFISGRSV
jgi:hypothetical protein